MSVRRPPIACILLLSACLPAAPASKAVAVNLTGNNPQLIVAKPGPAVLRNCVSAYPVTHKTGTPGTALWLAAGSKVSAEHCTFYAYGTGVSLGTDGEPTFCSLTDCLLAGSPESKSESTEPRGHIIKSRCVEAIIGAATTATARMWA